MRAALWIAVAVCVAAALWVARDHRMAAARIVSVVVPVPELAPAGDEGPGVEWFDDYFTVERIGDQTFAIGEPRFYQGNYNYLLVGSERAFLFDSGPGVRDIVPVVESLTDLPVVAVPSHLHYDHIGNHRRFGRIGVVALPELRARAEANGGVLRPTAEEHVGFVEGIPIPDLPVTDWLPPGGTVDLGGRTLHVIHTPGHTRDSVSLFDAERAQLFTGDYVNEGALFAFVPTSSLGDYLRTTEALLERLPENVQLLTAHRMTPPGAPILRYSDLSDLRTTLLGIRSGTAQSTGLYPRVYRINDELELWADVRWAQDWGD